MGHFVLYLLTSDIIISRVLVIYKTAVLKKHRDNRQQEIPLTDIFEPFLHHIGPWPYAPMFLRTNVPAS